MFSSRLVSGAFALFCFSGSIATAQTSDPHILLEKPLKSTIYNNVGNPVHIDTCRALERVYDQTGFPTGIVDAVYVTAHNVSKKTIEAFAFTISPKDIFNAPAGNWSSSLYSVNLAPGESMPEDYNFTDGAKEPSYGGLVEKWSQVYQIDCFVTRVRYTDGTVYP